MVPAGTLPAWKALTAYTKPLLVAAMTTLKRCPAYVPPVIARSSMYKGEAYMCGAYVAPLTTTLSKAGESQSFPKPEPAMAVGVRTLSTLFQPVRCRLPWKVS